MSEGGNISNRFVSEKQTRADNANFLLAVSSMMRRHKTVPALRFECTVLSRRLFAVSLFTKRLQEFRRSNFQNKTDSTSCFTSENGQKTTSRKKLESGGQEVSANGSSKIKSHFIFK